MNPLDGRYLHLHQALAGYQYTGIPLVEFDGIKILPSCADDLGIYVIIPKIAYLFSISIDQASLLFFMGSMTIAFASALTASFLLYPSLPARLVSLTALLAIAHQSWRVGHVYSMYASCVIGLIPWCIYLLQKQYRPSYGLNLYYANAGLMMATSHYIRAYCFLPSFVFIVCATVLKKQIPILKKITLLSILSTAMALPVMYFTHSYNQYVSFLNKHDNTIVPSLKNHPLWHSIYCGFGFLMYGNNDNIEWADNFPEKKIGNKAAYPTAEYEKLVKQEVIDLFTNQRTFFINTIFAKAGVLLLLLLLAANIGLIAAFLYRKEFWLEFSWVVSFLASAIFPLISLPIMTYSIGFVCIGILYGFMSINDCIMHYWTDKHKAYAKRSQAATYNKI